MQAVLTRKRSGCWGSATSVEGWPFTVRRPPAHFGGELSGQSRCCSSRRLFSEEDGLGCGVASELQRVPTKTEPASFKDRCVPCRHFMIAEMPATTLRDAVLSHPTIVEGFNALFAAV
jgi:hypothetical protein